MKERGIEREKKRRAKMGTKMGTTNISVWIENPREISLLDSYIARGWVLSGQ